MESQMGKRQILKEILGLLWWSSFRSWKCILEQGGNRCWFHTVFLYIDVDFSFSLGRSSFCYPISCWYLTGTCLKPPAIESLCSCRDIFLKLNHSQSGRVSLVFRNSLGGYDAFIQGCALPWNVVAHACKCTFRLLRLQTMWDTTVFR